VIEELSNLICETCNQSLANFSEFQIKMIENQKRLLKLEGKCTAQTSDSDTFEYQATSDPFIFESVKVEHLDEHIKVEFSVDELSPWLEIKPEVISKEENQNLQNERDSLKKSVSKRCAKPIMPEGDEGLKRKYNKTSPKFRKEKFGKGRKLCPFCAKVVCDFAYSRHVSFNRVVFSCSTFNFRSFSRSTCTLTKATKITSSVIPATIRPSLKST
jgi:hypothetical protein